MSMSRSRRSRVFTISFPEDLASQVDELALEHDFALRDAADVQEIVDHAAEVTQLPIDDLVLPSASVVARGVVGEDGERVLDRRQRVAQLVAEHREKLVLAAVGVLETAQEIAKLVLAVPPAQGAAHGTEKRRDAHRPLEDGHVAERAERLQDDLDAVVVLGEDDEWEIGPRRLRFEQTNHLAKEAPREGLYGEDCDAGAREHFALELFQIAAGPAGEARTRQDFARERAVLAGGRENERAVVELILAAHSASPKTGFSAPV